MAAELEPRKIDADALEAMKARIVAWVDRSANIKFLHEFATSAKPGEPRSCEAVKEVEKLIAEHKEALRPYKTEGEYWVGAERRARQSIGEAVKQLNGIDMSLKGEKGWSYGGTGIEHISGLGSMACENMSQSIDDIICRESTDRMDGPVLYLSKAVGEGMRWEAMKNRGFGRNPYEPIMKMFEAGLLPQGFCRVERFSTQETFITDIPIQVDGQHVLGCYDQNDQAVMRYHAYTKSCEHATTFAPSRKISFGSRWLEEYK